MSVIANAGKDEDVEGLTELVKEIETFVTNAVQERTWEHKMIEDDDSMVNDYAGGNVDDAYEGGIDSGRQMLAEDLNYILQKYGWGIKR